VKIISTSFIIKYLHEWSVPDHTVSVNSKKLALRNSLLLKQETDRQLKGKDKWFVHEAPAKVRRTARLSM